MKMLASATIIRGNGACEMFMNGLKDEEIEKMKEQYENELSAVKAELESTKNKRNELLTNRLPTMKAVLAKPTSIIERFRERIVITWCQIYGIGSEFKWWTYEG